jgi:hypothetical protein
MQGCFSPSPRPLPLGPLKFNRCPVTFVRTSTRRVLRMFDDGALTASSYETKRLMPAKRLAALWHVDYLFKLRNASDNRT